MPIWWVRRPLIAQAFIVAFWGVLVSLSLFQTVRMYDEQAHSVALARARMLFDVVETARLWNARHGGVYASVAPDTPPNPYLEEAGRDVVINGEPFTLVNPAYMTRQLSELVRASQGIWFNITSLNPINPGNRPDAWEAEALHRFEAGTREVLERTETQAPDDDAAAPLFRYMQVLMVTEPCLDCHRKQGYKIGDVRGGISVSIPAAQVTGELAEQRTASVFAHVVVFLLLAGVSLFAFRQQRSAWLGLEEARAQQERLVAARTAELSEANAKLAQSNKDLENFAYIASHDLQEPLRMVSGYASLIRRRYASSLDDNGREFMTHMIDGATRMERMIKDLLQYSRVERAELRQEQASPADLVAEALGNLAIAVEEAGAVVETDLALPPLLCDGGLMVRVFQNLIGNALKYRAPDRAPRIRITGRTVDGTCRIDVVDNGLGIPEDSRERVFQIFQRIRTAGGPAGSGMGLAICRRIVERHGGRIWIEDAPHGEGSCFSMMLPLAATEAASAPSATAAAPA